MVTTEVRNQIDRIWDAVWSGGMSNPLEVVEQTRALERASLLNQPVEDNPFPLGRDELRWSFIKHKHPEDAYDAG